MSDHPIIFTGDSVKAILAGTKTQTRRVLRPPFGIEQVKAAVTISCPYGKPSGRLWVKEAFAIQSDVDGDPPPHCDDRPLLRNTDDYGAWSWKQPHYRATDATPPLECSHHKCEGGPCKNPWRSSVFMPRWASRLTLEIESVRVQRLQEISEEDARAEGVDCSFISNGLWWQGGSTYTTECNPAFDPTRAITGARGAFGYLWDSINAKRGYGWDTNPWVWCLSFRRADQGAPASEAVGTPQEANA